MKSLIFLFVMIVVVAMTGFVSSASYYVNQTTGLDANDGLSPSTPWKTISKLNGASFSAGDIIYLERGQVWREQLNFPSSGSSSSPITITDYGNESLDKPILRASNLITTWNYQGGYIWNATGLAVVGSPNANMSQLFVAENIKAVYVDNVSLLTGNNTWTYDAAINTLWLNTSLSSTDINSSVEVSVREKGIDIFNQNYTVFQNIQIERTHYDSIQVRGSSHDVLFDAISILQWVPKVGDTYNAFWTTETTKNITIKNSIFGKNTGDQYSDQNWSGSTAMLVEGTNQTIFNNTVYHTFLGEEDANAFFLRGIYLKNVSGLTLISNNTIYYVGGHCIYIQGTYYSSEDELNIYDNNVSYCGQAGVSAYQTRDLSSAGRSFGKVYRNVVSFCDRLAGTTGGNNNAAVGIHLNDGAWNGTNAPNSSTPFVYWEIFNNTVYNCQAPDSPNLEDSGGLAADYNADNSVFYHNLIYNNWGKGMYVYNADNVTFWGNIVYWNDAGITISTDGSNETANNNKVYNNVFYSNYNTNDYGPNYQAEIVFGLRDTNTSIKNNILYSNESNIPYHFYNTSTSGADVDYNIVFNDGNLSLAYDSQQIGFMNLTTWQEYYPFDSNSFNSDPKFTNEYEKSFNLTSSSPAIDTGVNVGLTYDLLGVSIPQGPGYDMGVYEYVAPTDSEEEVAPVSNSPGGGSSPSKKTPVANTTSPSLPDVESSEESSESEPEIEQPNPTNSFSENKKLIYLSLIGVLTLVVVAYSIVKFKIARRKRYWEL